MTEEVNEQIDKTFRVVSGFVGRYSMAYLNKVYAFEFPVENKLEENLLVLEELKSEILKAIAKQQEQEKAKQEEEQNKKDQQ